MKKIILCSITLLSTISFSQELKAKLPAIQWQKKYGGSQSGIAYAIQQTKDNGYIVAGTTTSNDGEVTNHHGGEDIWIVKLNDVGAIQWQKALGGSNDDTASSIQQTNDGGYIIAGTTQSIDGDITHKKEENGFDCWLIKLDVSGNIQWQKVVGGDSYNNPESIQQTKDKGFIIVGKTNNNVVTSESDFNFYVLKLDENGTKQWKKSLGGSNDEYANSVHQTKDGGYIIAGTTQSIDGDVTNRPGGTQDFWVVKLNNTGEIVWQKAFGETTKDIAYNIQQTNDGGYIMAGSSGIEDIDATLIKLNDKGIIEWQKNMGGSKYDEIKSIQQTKDNGYILAGVANSTDRDLEKCVGADYGFWVVKLDTNIK